MKTSLSKISNKITPQLSLAKKVIKQKSIDELSKLGFSPIDYGTDYLCDYTHYISYKVRNVTSDRNTRQLVIDGKIIYNGFYPKFSEDGSQVSYIEFDDTQKSEKIVINGKEGKSYTKIISHIFDKTGNLMYLAESDNGLFFVTNENEQLISTTLEGNPGVNLLAYSGKLLSFNLREKSNVYKNIKFNIYDSGAVAHFDNKGSIDVLIPETSIWMTIKTTEIKVKNLNSLIKHYGGKILEFKLENGVSKYYFNNQGIGIICKIVGNSVIIDGKNFNRKTLGI